MTTNSNRYPIWTREEDKTFENGLALYGNIDQWAKIAATIPGKSIEEVKEHYLILVDDIMSIEAGNVPLPDYGSPSEILADLADGSPEDLGCAKRSAKSLADRRKAVPWTEEEHGLFLQGMDKLGKGDWRGIARHFVMTRTPAQVASHAQKYFIRMEPGKKKRRPTIHDVPVDGESKSGGQRRLIEGESSQFPIKIGDLAEFPVQMTDICMHDDNIIPAHEGIIPTPWMTGIGIHDKHTNYFGIDTIDNISTPQRYLHTGPMTGIGISGDASEVFQFEAQGSMPSLQGVIPNAYMTGIGAERTGIGMGGEVFQFSTVGSISSLQGAMNIGTGGPKNMPVSQLPIISAERTGNCMGGHTTGFFQFDPLGSLSYLQGAIGIDIEAPKNIPISQGPIFPAERTGIGMGGTSEFFQFDPLGSLSSLQGAIGGIGIEAPKNMSISQRSLLSAERTGVGLDTTTPIMQRLVRPAQTYGFAGMDYGMAVQELPSNAQSTLLAPMDTIDNTGSVIPSTDVGIFGFCPTTRHPNN